MTDFDRPWPRGPLPDSIMRQWGWRIATVEERRAELRTMWLYFSGPDVIPGAGRQCEDGSDVGIRLFVRPRASRGDSVQFVIRGEMRVLAGADRALADRRARAGFDAVGAALQEGLLQAAGRSNTAPVRLASVSGEVGLAEGGRWDGCATIRQ